MTSTVHSVYTVGLLGAGGWPVRGTPPLFGYLTILTMKPLCTLARKLMESQEFVVASVTSKELMRDFVLDYCERMNWGPGKMDDSQSPCTGLWVLEAGNNVESLNGQPVTGVAMFQHNAKYAFVGLYFCEEEHRGKGYGLKTWRVARAALNPDVNLVLDSVPFWSFPLHKRGF